MFSIQREWRHLWSIKAPWLRISFLAEIRCSTNCFPIKTLLNAKSSSMWLKSRANNANTARCFFPSFLALTQTNFFKAVNLRRRSRLDAWLCPLNEIGTSGKKAEPSDKLSSRRCLLMNLNVRLSRSTKKLIQSSSKHSTSQELYKRGEQKVIILEFIFHFYLKFRRRTQRTIDSYKVLAFTAVRSPRKTASFFPRPHRHPNYSRGVALELFAVSHSTHSDVRTFLSSVQRLMNEFPCHLSDDKGFVQRKKRNIAHVTSYKRCQPWLRNILLGVM